MLNGHAYGLAMSRGLGDVSAIGVTAEPLVDVFSIADLLAMVRKELQETCRTDDLSSSTATSSSSETTGTCTTNTGDSEPVDNDDSNNIQLFVVSATDGLLDYFEPTDLARAMGASFYDPASQLHPLKAVDSLVTSSKSSRFSITSCNRVHGENRRSMMECRIGSLLRACIGDL
jgi:hypothetical protein